MSQASLPFKRITTDEWRSQVAAIAAEPAPPRPPPKRPVGRPKRVRNVNELLAEPETAAAGADAEADAAAEANEERPSKQQRGKYTDWFGSPYIHDILREYGRDFRPALAVQRLKASAPDDRYARLTHSTVMSWFDKNHKLWPRFQAYLECGEENVRQNGLGAAFEEAPAVEAEIKQTLQQMRAAGTTVNSHVIRWVMQGIIHLRTPVESRIRTLKLGRPFVCAWARKHLKWSWRKSTTAASKLPLDWEERGLHMAMRIAATMEMKEVSAWVNGSDK